MPAATLENYRAEWLTVRRENPISGRTKLKNQFQRVYTWLRRNDREWLEANLPPKQQTNLPSPRVDWGSRDAELAEAVRLSATNLYKQEGRPNQVIIAAIARELGQLALIQKHLDKLPLTAKVLTDVVETRESFALRRINWVVHCYRQEGSYPQRWQLIRRAGLRPELITLQPIHEAIDSALELLHGTFPLEPNYEVLDQQD